MKKINYVVLFLCSFLLLESCKKSEWKKPTEVIFMVDINKDVAMNGNLSFFEGQVVLREIAFDGERIQADDVYFDVDFDEGLKVLFSSTVANNQLVFDIPQGSYSKIRIDFSAEKSAFELIKIIGKYKSTSGIEYPIILELDQIEFYDKIAKNPQGDVEIDLVAGNPTKVLIKLDPIFWLGNLSTNQLDAAQTTLVDGVESILIKNNTNEGLFDIIDERVGMGTEIIFN